MEVVSKYVTIKSHLEGAPKESDFEIKTAVLSLSLNLGCGDIIVKHLMVSIDPHQLNRMKRYSSSHDASSFSAGISPGEKIEAYGVARVVATGNPEFNKGDLVIGFITWGDHSHIPRGGMIRKLDPMGFPLSYHVGILGLSGLTSYAGLVEICKPKSGDSFWSVGNLVGQYARLLGCYVVGCAGNDKKVKLLKQKLGFNEAFNYKKETDLKSTLKRYFPDGIDIYFDNFGGEMQDTAIANMNCYGRNLVCGVISEYTNPGKRSALDMVRIIYRRIHIQGFLAVDYIDLYPHFLSKTIDYIKTGKLEVLEDISHGLDSIPSAFTGLFRGDNVGKKLVQIADD